LSSKDLTIEKATTEIQSLVDSQGVDGNWNYDPYMHGMYNGLVVALSVLNDKAIEQLRNAPDEWLSDERLREKHPTLHSAWEEYKIIEKLIKGSDE
jgi:hypothetical protein